MLEEHSADLTQLLRRVAGGDGPAGDELFRRMYFELRSEAERCLRRQHADDSIWATGLVHDAYLKLCQGGRVEWESRKHFLFVAAKAMRSLVIDHYRARRRKKRRAEGCRESVSSIFDSFEGRLANRVVDVMDLEAALCELEGRHPRAAKVVEMRFYLGLSMAEIGEGLSEPKRRIERDWAFARAFLAKRLRGDASA